MRVVHLTMTEETYRHMTWLLRQRYGSRANTETFMKKAIAEVIKDEAQKVIERALDMDYAKAEEKVAAHMSDLLTCYSCGNDFRVMDKQFINGEWEWFEVGADFCPFCGVRISDR